MSKVWLSKLKQGTTLKYTGIYLAGGCSSQSQSGWIILAAKIESCFMPSDIFSASLLK